MGPAGFNLFFDLNDMDALAEYGVLFLLFEQGLELTVERLKSLSSYAFGMGTLQVILCTAAFFGFPFFGGVQFQKYGNYHVEILVDEELRLRIPLPVIKVENPGEFGGFQGNS